MIEGSLLAKAIISGANNITNQKQVVDELNVFPVPDGDTGTNMSMTIGAGKRELALLESPTVEKAADVAASALLRGARGNSGVILSLLFRGFSKGLKGKTTADGQDIAHALSLGVEAAYKAVMKPTEGTILTVARLAAEAAEEVALQTNDPGIVFDEILRAAKAALEQTPELLPVLKKAGVVDAGGKGFVVIFEGMAHTIHTGEVIEAEQEEKAKQKAPANVVAEASGDIKFGYCTEFIVDKKQDCADPMKLRAYLESIGDSVVCVDDEDIIKVHVHTNTPGRALSYALELGELDRIKIENMLEENRQVRAKREKEKKLMGMVSICAGKGIADIFKDLFVDKVIEGGQTMNPSANDIADAVMRVNASNVFVFPNNKNIILAANQAQSLTKDKDIIVIPTKTVPQGITAVISFMPEADVDTNMETMQEAVRNVKTGQVTYAVRDTRIDDKEIHEGDIMGIGDDGILAVGQSVEETAKEMLAQLVDEDSELISLYYGQDILPEDAERFSADVEALYPDVDVDVHMGGQPIYYYVLSVE